MFQINKDEKHGYFIYPILDRIPSNCLVSDYTISGELWFDEIIAKAINLQVGRFQYELKMKFHAHLISSQMYFKYKRDAQAALNWIESACVTNKLLGVI